MLKRVRLIDVLNGNGELIATTEREGTAIEDMIEGYVHALVYYEVLQNENGGTSGHKHILRFYTREDLNDDIERGDIKITQ